MTFKRRFRSDSIGVIKLIVAVALSVSLLVPGPEVSSAESRIEDKLGYALDAPTHLAHVFIEQTLYALVLDRMKASKGAAQGRSKQFFKEESGYILEKRKQAAEALYELCTMDAAAHKANKGLLESLLKDDYFKPIHNMLRELYFNIVNYRQEPVPLSISGGRDLPVTKPLFEFYKEHARDKLRLFRLFPRVTSEILKIRKDEVQGYEVSDGRLVLTFDDGPTDNTRKILDILDRYKIRAAFFILGRMINQRTGPIVLRAKNSGHVMGQHTFNHLVLPKQPHEIIRRELISTTRAIERLAKVKVAFFRSPYGSRNEYALKVMDELAQKHILWNIDSKDWMRKLSDETITERVIRQSILYNGGIILFHETVGRTVTILPEIIEKLIKEGFVFSGLDEVTAGLKKEGLGPAKEQP